MKSKTNPLLTWLCGATLTVLLTLFGFILKLTADVATVMAQTKALNEQMRDVAQMVGELWRAQ